ncbi:sugar phosphate isomerase/epimerase family protein [Mediterraneibacter massiliensis]|uniref:sugar phosphate isomerase/epimerase family protein n=1 Tax=Mediterraneibacter massiliensis TaxID=1720300 RepID=UPI0022DFCA37|nr:sugar phosphate isomerase/epimerase family protein [Mediterraneibacter massiliensis]
MGADNIEFYGCFPHFHLDDVSYCDVKTVIKKLKSHKLSVVGFTPEQCLYPVNIAALDVSARKRSVEVFKKSIQYGSEMGAQFVVVLAGYGTLDEDEKITWRRSVESLGILGDMAEAYGVKLVLETSPREYTTTHNSKDVLRMIKEVGSRAVSGMIDTATLGFSGETMEQAIRDLEGNLSHVHVADGVPNGHLVLGEGKLDILGALKKLDDISYSGPLSLEILNDKYVRDPHRAMETSFRKLKEYLNTY